MSFGDRFSSSYSRAVRGRCRSTMSSSSIFGSGGNGRSVHLLRRANVKRAASLAARCFLLSKREFLQRNRFFLAEPCWSSEDHTEESYEVNEHLSSRRRISKSELTRIHVWPKACLSRIRRL